ncbi:MAG: hypothetical protein EU548_02960 [Promethearchaeota archaeon]|nr:MAG: hypothetical protein EU548_02960 [Candidatus Lokiarchaeota archaeon]
MFIFICKYIIYFIFLSFVEIIILISAQTKEFTINREHILYIGESSMIIGMCLGILDEKVGPNPIYNLNLNEDLSKKLTMKVMLGVMSFSTETDEKNLRGESIIPFLKEKIITFAYLFPIKDSNARGGFRQCSIIIAFDMTDRALVYENATTLARSLKSMSESIELKHIQNKKFPLSISENFDRIRSNLYETSNFKATKEKSNIDLVCPICSKKNNIEFPTIAKGLKFIEHQILKNEICEHSFIVYLDSKFNILGYKDPEIEVTDMKDMFSKLKSPYNN